LKISKDYEDKKLHIAKHHWSREVVTFIIEKKKNLTTPISATDSKILGLNDVFDKTAPVKKYVLSPTNSKSLVNSYFNIFLSPKPSSKRAQKKLATNQQNEVALEAIIKFQVHVKKLLQKKKEKKISSVFLHEKVNLQGKIDTIDEKIQDAQNDLKSYMNYKNELLIEMNDLILNHSNSNLNNPSTPSQASTKSFTQVSTHVFHQISTLKSTQASSSNTNHSLNIITPPSTRSKKKCIGLNCRRVSNHAIINKKYCLKYFPFLEINNNWFSKSCKGFVNNNVINQCNDCIQVKKNITNI